MKFYILIGLLIASITACNEPVALAESHSTGAVEQLSFDNNCANWNGASVQVKTFEQHWELAAFTQPGCIASSGFEQRYELDSRLAGVWQGHYIVDVGMADADREIYLLDASSGERAAEIWYVGELEFGAKGVAWFEPTRDEADVSKCPQEAEILQQWKAMGAVVMYAEKKFFDLEKRTLIDKSESSCYAMF